MVIMNVYYALAAQLLAQVIGGMGKAIWGLQFYSKRIAGYRIVEMMKKKKD